MTFLIFFVTLFLVPTLYAQVPSFDSMSDEDLDLVVKEFASNFVHTSATPPTSLGKLFGVEAAVIVGATESPGIEQLSKQVDPSSDVPYIPHAWLLGGVSIPYGVSVELNVLPELDLGDLKMSHTSVGLKWSVTDQFFKNLPFDWAVRTYYTKSEISYQQTVSNPSFPATSNVNVSFENTMIGGDTLIGFDLSVIEPYVGLGFVSTDGELSGVAATSTPYSLFDDLTSRSKSSKQSSERIIAGCQFNLALMSVGLEYTRVFSINRLSAKLGLKF